MAYNLNEIAMITGLTTRTLRNYLKADLLKGAKISGSWSFTEEELDSFMASPAVKQAVKAKRNAVVYDFLSNPFKKENRICTIMDFPVSDEEAMEISSFFCKRITEKGKDIQFTFNKENGLARFILCGSEKEIVGFMKAYYER